MSHPFSTDEAHLDHNLPERVRSWLYESIAEEVRSMARNTVLVRTYTLPERWLTVTGFIPVESLPCALHGPLADEASVAESEVYYETRGGRQGPSRMCRRTPGATRKASIIVGWFGDWAAPKLFTAFSGPSAPRESFDPALSPEEKAQSEAFWAQHALSPEA